LLIGRRGRVVAQAAVLTAVVGGTVTFAQLEKRVELTVDGRTTQVRALTSTVGGLLDSEGVNVSSRDLVSPARTAGLSDGDHVTVRYARPLRVTIDGTDIVYWTTELRVDSALDALGIRSEGARLSVSRSAAIGRTGLSMALTSPKTVTVAADGSTDEVTTTAATVADLLAERGLVPGPRDTLSVTRSTPITDGLVVALTRITSKRVTETEAVPFGTQKRSSSALYKGETKVVTAGKKGTRSAVYDVVMADGKVTSKKLVSATVSSPPVTQVVDVGTKAKPTTTSAASGSVGGSADSLNWPALAQCESGGNPKIVSSNGLYYGLYQFSLSTWRAVGGSGRPTDASSAEQTLRAKMLYNKAGAGQWPVCGKKLFT
jgi:uncharacterized protein YabE (DUF348 family)